MKTQEVIDHFGSKAAIAELLGCHKSTVSMWGDEPPLGRQYEIQALTKGKLKAAPKPKAS